MRSITFCPNCQTQYFVSEEQLGKHQGQVRCGHCLHVFDGNVHRLDLSTGIVSHIEDTSLTSEPAAVENVANSTKLNEAEDTKPHHVKNLSSNKRSRINLYAILLLACFFFQCIFFLRNQLVIYYPNTKPYLEQICTMLSCQIALPKKIESIVIDDSDIKEDPIYIGLMHVSSTIINQANFSQAYPNIELTLTDIDDKPRLRRLFKPNEYLNDHSNIINGMASKAEIKVNIPIKITGFNVAGYRVFLTY